MKAILENPYLRTEFKSFLSTERGDENIQVIFSIFEVNLIQFWEAVEIFKSLEEESLAEEANLIVRRFVSVQSERTINIAGDVKDRIMKSMKEYKHTKGLFDEATQQIFHLMKNDSLIRFLTKCKEDYGDLLKSSQ